ncbi:hypothetical protein H5410_026103 [Solanum commersonii]|uniref:Uncharacterized protein n=1 Tax=Solanum commersonii TaxID=4109 RepID=A0A9J5YV46_SOLCO|nr:hypothetical protein H5410_026103 [Solanum commersonii]
MVDKDKGQCYEKAIWGRDIDEPSRVNISKSLGFNYSLSTHQSHNASTHVAPQSGYTISTPMWYLVRGYQTLRGYSHLGRSNIPSSSASRCNSLNTSSGSIRLSNLHIESNGSSLILPPPDTFGCTCSSARAIETILGDSS